MYILWPTRRSVYNHSLSRGLKAVESSCLTRQRCDITLISNNLCEKKTSIRGQLQWRRGTKAVLDKALLSWLAGASGVWQRFAALRKPSALTTHTARTVIHVCRLTIYGIGLWVIYTIVVGRIIAQSKRINLPTQLAGHVTHGAARKLIQTPCWQIHEIDLCIGQTENWPIWWRNHQA